MVLTFLCFILFRRLKIKLGEKIDKIRNFQVKIDNKMKGLSRNEGKNFYYNRGTVTDAKFRK